MSLMLTYVGSCGDPPPLAPMSEDATVDVARPPRRDARSNDEFVPPTPASVPEGWVRYDDYNPHCGLYIPSDKKYLPEPIRWEPCTNPVGDAGTPDPQSMVCRRMVTDWPIMSWQILNRNFEQAVEWRIDHPYALTCDEIFARAGSKSHIDVVRVRLDSLGPGTPPD
jgi:hypothetical protein